MFDICAHDLSELFWKRLLHMEGWSVRDIGSTMITIGDKLEVARENMAYKTGSIPLSTACWLNMLTFQLQPNNVAEVGTFLGKSTMALVDGMQRKGKLWTCDASNDLPIVGPFRGTGTEVFFHANTPSTRMFAEMTDSIDLFFFDGRVMPEDLEHIRRLSHPNTVFAFDDFEGTEKGVANASYLRTKDHALIYPPKPELLHPYGVTDRSTLALLIPTSLFRWTAQ